MRASFYLIVADNGTVRTSQAKPDAVKSNEVSMFLNFDLPDHLFQKPLLKADIMVEADEKKPVQLSMKLDALGDWLSHKGEE